ncbi:MAG: hypothetical protein M3238_04195 [Actinomycetota bacterium]|nr:hypothetical protein [Actinomycetota bacterium]
MAVERTCPFMSGPSNGSVAVAPAKWWLAISRDVLVNDVRRRRRSRPAVKCRTTPTFSRVR